MRRNISAGVNGGRAEGLATPSALAGFLKITMFDKIPVFNVQIECINKDGKIIDWNNLILTPIVVWNIDWYFFISYKNSQFDRIITDYKYRAQSFHN